MVKNKLTVLFALVIGVVLISGCIGQQQTPDKPYITNVNFDKPFGVEGGTINVAVSVTNPTAVDYNTGTILIQADSPNCFGMNWVNIGGQNGNVQGYLSSISVAAGATNSVLLTMTIPYNNPTTCYQPANHLLNIFVLQNGQTLSSKTIDFPLYQQKK